IPGQVVPGQAVPGDVVPGDVVPRQVVPGDVVPGNVVPRDVVPGQVVPGQVVPGQVVRTERWPQDPTQQPGVTPRHSVAIERRVQRARRGIRWADTAIRRRAGTTGDGREGLYQSTANRRRTGRRTRCLSEWPRRALQDRLDLVRGE